MTRYSAWAKLKEELFLKFTAGFLSPAPVLYFFSVVVLAGGVGVWLPLFNGSEGIKSNVMTYVFAMLSAVLADFLLERENHNEGYIVFVITVVVLIITSTIASLNIDSFVWSIALMVFSVLLLFCLWWMLITPVKFEVSLDDMKNATVGSDKASKTAKERSLSALMKNRGEGK